MDWSLIHVLDKIREGYLRSQESGVPALGVGARMISLHNFWLQKPTGTESVEETVGPPNSSS